MEILGVARPRKGERADANEEHAQKKRAIKDTEALMGADLSFVDDVKKQCAEMDAEWDERQKIRAEEAEGISKAIEILDAEDAHSNFKKTFSFLQHSAKSEPEGKAKAASAARVLAEAAHSDPRLAALAMQTKIDKFTKAADSFGQSAASGYSSRYLCPHSSKALPAPSLLTLFR